MQQLATKGTALSSGYIRMSSAGKCRRQIGYEVLGFPESDLTPVEGRNVMELGDGTEAILLRRLREEGWEVDHTRWDGGEQLEVRLSDPPRVGHPDGRCRHPELTRNRWVLLECKGMNAFQFRSFLKEGFIKSHPQYLDQVAQYGAALGEMGLVADPSVAVVAALDRDTGKWGYQRVRWESEAYARRREALLVVLRDELVMGHFLRVAAEEMTARPDKTLQVLASHVAALKEQGPFAAIWRPAPGETPQAMIGASPVRAAAIASSAPR